MDIISIIITSFLTSGVVTTAINWFVQSRERDEQRRWELKREVEDIDRVQRLEWHNERVCMVYHDDVISRVMDVVDDYEVYLQPLAVHDDPIPSDDLPEPEQVEDVDMIDVMYLSFDLGV